MGRMVGGLKRQNQGRAEMGEVILEERGIRRRIEIKAENGEQESGGRR